MEVSIEAEEFMGCGVGGSVDIVVAYTFVGTILQVRRSRATGEIQLGVGRGRRRVVVQCRARCGKVWHEDAAPKLG